MLATQLQQSPRFNTAFVLRSVSPRALSMGLSLREVERLETLVIDRIKVKAGAALCRMGDPLRSLYAVRVGSFKNCKVSVEGHEQIIGFPIAGEFLGLDAIGTHKHTCDVVALEDSEVCSIHFSSLEKLTQDMPALQHNLSKLLSREIVRSHHMLLLMGNMNAEERLATFLLNLSHSLSLLGNSPKNFVLKMRRDDIGSYLGLRLETICRCIARLQLHALVEISGRDVKIVNMEGLRYLAATSAIREL